MNAVEIEEAISLLAEQTFDPEEFPYLFLEAFGNKETTIKKLRKGESNKSDLGGVLRVELHKGTYLPIALIYSVKDSLIGFLVRRCSKNGFKAYCNHVNLET